MKVFYCYQCSDAYLEISEDTDVLENMLNSRFCSLLSQKDLCETYVPEEISLITTFEGEHDSKQE